MTHENEKNIGGGAQHHGSDEQKISEMLSGLKRVEAPKNFDFHLKARIANGRPAVARTASLFPILKYALPLALVLFVSAGLIFSGWLDEAPSNEMVVAPAPPVSNAAPLAVSTPFAMPDNPVSDSSSTDVASGFPPAPVEKEPTGRGAAKVVTPRRPSPDADRQPGGSRVSTGGNAENPLLPKEFDITNSNTRQMSNRPMPGKPEGVRESLKTMGVEVELDKNVWTVRSVKSGSVGGDMGLKSGDRLEAIDGKAVDGTTTYNGEFRAVTIKVQRDGTSVDLSVQVRPDRP